MNSMKQVNCQVSGHEIANLLRQLGRGEIVASLVDPYLSWDRVYSSNVEFDIAGYRIVIFNDCDQLDYVDSVTTPDGRLGDFSEWQALGEEPVSLLTAIEQQAVLICLKAAV